MLIILCLIQISLWSCKNHANVNERYHLVFYSASACDLCFVFLMCTNVYMRASMYVCVLYVCVYSDQLPLPTSDGDKWTVPWYPVMVGCAWKNKFLIYLHTYVIHTSNKLYIYLIYTYTYIHNNVLYIVW